MIAGGPSLKEVLFFWGGGIVRAQKGHRNTGGLTLAPERWVLGERHFQSTHRVRERRFI